MGGRALKCMDANYSAWMHTAPHGRACWLMDTHTSAGAWTRMKQSWKGFQRRDAGTEPKIE